MLKFGMIAIICSNILFVNYNPELWNERDFKEFLSIQQNNRCPLKYGLPCIKKFIKQPFNQDDVRRYKVICGDK